MTARELILKMSQLFKDGNDAKFETILAWIERCNLTEFQIEALYEEITENYKYKSFPNLAEIKEIWMRAIGERSFEKFDNPVIKQRAESRQLMPMTIIKKCKAIRKKIHDNESLDPLDMDYLAQWGDLLSEYLIAQDKKMPEREIKMRNEHVKACIINNVKIDPIANPLDINIKINGVESNR